MDATYPQIESTSVEASLTKLLKTKDHATDAHSYRVAEITSEWLDYEKTRNRWPAFNEVDLVLAARLHDVGKIGVKNEILNKPGTLTPAEKEHISQHAELGYRMICETDLRHELALAVRHHHERWDGSGYPMGLKQNEIPFFAQVIALVDTYDAITSDRPYRKAQSTKVAIAEIGIAAGSQFSPTLVASFVKFLIARNG
jgi:HD-GYP domain-containing protein (c-di-GMP phosphodiesterase class II)